jgi:hypothetical protein
VSPVLYFRDLVFETGQVSPILAFEDLILVCLADLLES